MPAPENTQTVPTVPEPSAIFVERAAELRQLLENPTPDNPITAERIRTRRRALRLQLQTEFVNRFELYPDKGNTARRGYYRRFCVSTPRQFDHKEFYRLWNWCVVVSQPYYNVEDDLTEELAALAYKHFARFYLLPKWSYWFPGHTTLILFQFPSLRLKPRL